MEKKYYSWSVNEVYKMYCKDKLDLLFECFEGCQTQRNYIWGNDRASKLIDSALRGFSLQLLSVTQLNNKYCIMDGKQRVLSLMNYLNNEYELDKSLASFDDRDIKGLKFNELDEDLQQKILDTEIMVCEQTGTPDEMIEAFIRLNNGVSLSSMEIFRAKLGTKISFINEMVSHPFFKLLKSTNSKRFKEEEIALHLLMLEFNPNTGLSMKEKKTFIDYVTAFNDFNDTLKSSVLKKLDYLHKSFDNEKYLELKKDKYLKKSHLTSLYPVLNHAFKKDVGAETFFDWTYDFFVEHKDAKNAYWVSASKSSTTQKSSVQNKINFLTKNFNKYIKNKLK